MSDIFREIDELYERHGSAAYLGEEVTQLEHALQAATLAENAGASSALIVAALLHDIGHLLDADADDPAVIKRDLHHERLAADWLRGRFTEAVVRPVEMHVAAKRYLCAIEPDYAAGLSPTSVVTLQLQGGVMSPEEVEAFGADPHAEAAVCVRRWDDGAKVSGWQTPPLAHFRRHLESVLLG